MSYFSRSHNVTIKYSIKFEVVKFFSRITKDYNL